MGAEEVREEAFIEIDAGGAICHPLPAFVDDPVPNGHVELAVRLGPKTFSRIIELEYKNMSWRNASTNNSYLIVDVFQIGCLLFKVLLELF